MVFSALRLNLGLASRKLDDVFVIHLPGGCLRFPVGISDPFIIPDASITASTSSAVGFPTDKSRMSESIPWCLPDAVSGSPHYLQVDFGENVVVCAVETRGYNNGGQDLYTQEFKLSFEADGAGGFTDYTEDGDIRVRNLGYY